MADNSRTKTTHRITPAAFAAWLHEQGQEPSKHVAAWFSAKGVAWPLVSASEFDATTVIVPPDGWNVQSPFGILKINRETCLARLEDVHAWLMRRDGIPSASAVAKVFGPFIADANSERGMERGADDVRKSLHLTDLSDYAASVQSFAGRRILEEMASLVPYVPHHHFDRGTLAALMYALGLMAGEVWAPHEYEIDLDERLAGYGVEGCFPTVAKSREILGRFAVPFAVAHELWGWGTVAATESEADATPAALSIVRTAPIEAPAPAFAPTGKVPQKSQKPEWTGERLAQERAGLKGRNTTQQLVEMSGLQAREITRREKAFRDETRQTGGRTAGQAA